MPITTIKILALLGFILSVYFLYVKYKNKNAGYKALCDISKVISCSRAAASKQSSLAILPNVLYGLIFYMIVFLLEPNQIVFYLSFLASLISLYLVYVSIKIRIICPVCISTYIVNFLLAYLSFQLI